MFRVGQKVVCVDARNTLHLKDEEIYTVIGIVEDFLEVDCEPDQFGDRCYFTFRFRPIVERETDISIFKAMLTPAGSKREAV